MAMSSWGLAQAAFGVVLAALASEPSARQLTVLVAAASRGAAQGATLGVENTEGLGIVAELEEYLSILKVQNVAQAIGQLRQRGRADLASRLRKVAAGRHPIAHPDVSLKACLLELTECAHNPMEAELEQGTEGFGDMEKTTNGTAREELGGKPPSKADRPKAQHHPSTSGNPADAGCKMGVQSSFHKEEGADGVSCAKAKEGAEMPKKHVLAEHRSSVAELGGNDKYRFEGTKSNLSDEHGLAEDLDSDTKPTGSGKTYPEKPKKKERDRGKAKNHPPQQLRLLQQCHAIDEELARLAKVTGAEHIVALKLEEKAQLWKLYRAAT